MARAARGCYPQLLWFPSYVCWFTNLSNFMRMSMKSTTLDPLVNITKIINQFTYIQHGARQLLVYKPDQQVRYIYHEPNR